VSKGGRGERERGVTLEGELKAHHKKGKGGCGQGVEKRKGSPPSIRGGLFGPGEGEGLRNC